MKTATRKTGGATVAAARERRPFLRIEAVQSAELSETALAGLECLEEMLAGDVAGLVRGLVAYSLAGQQRPQRKRRLAPTLSSINRRRRAARQWIQAILQGKVDAETLHAVGHNLLPQLAGAGPELHRGAGLGRDCVEYLRGAVTARIFDAHSASLVPHAKALHSFEAVLAIHLAAYQGAVRSSAAS